jgi:hypothetical protein
MTTDANESRRIRREQETMKWQEGVADVLEDMLTELRKIRRNTAFLVPPDQQEPEAIGVAGDE